MFYKQEIRKIVCYSESMRSFEGGFGTTGYLMAASLLIFSFVSIFLLIRQNMTPEKVPSNPVSSPITSLPSAREVPRSFDSSLEPEGSPSDTTTNAKVDILEKRITALEAKIKDKISPVVASPSPTTNPKVVKELFIPIGSSADQIGSTDWVDWNGLTFSLDPANYPGYTSMQLEANLRLNAGGIAYARIYNSNDSLPISSSDVTTTSTVYSLVNSGQFSLPTGKKVYKIQGKSSSGDTIFIQNIRLRVSY